MQDHEHMEQVKAGHPEAMAELYARHHGRVLGYFLRLTRQRATAEDLVQEVFLRMLNYRNSFKSSAPFVPWMFGIAHRLHLDHCNRRTLEAGPEVLEAHADAAADTHHRVEHQSDQELLERALARLDPKKRELLLLSREPDLSYQELAQLMGCSLASIKVQVHRALKELRTRYLELQGGAR